MTVADDWYRTGADEGKLVQSGGGGVQGFCSVVSLFDPSGSRRIFPRTRVVFAEKN